MSAPSFNSTQAVHFDLAHGAVRAGSGDDRVLLVPIAALADLARTASNESVAALAKAIGAAIGRRAASRIGDAATSSLEEFITQLAGEAALAGVGVWSLERWGRALVVVIDDGAPPTAFVAPLVGAAIEAASGRKVACGLLASDQRSARVLVSSDRAVERVKQWVASGVSWGDAITRLHGASS